MVWVLPKNAPLLLSPELARVNLNDQEVTALLGGLPAGGAPWLIETVHSLFGDDHQSADVYLAPTSLTAGLRRGKILRLTRSGSRPMDWTVRPASEDYAQVALPGKDFDVVRSADDPHRPFRVAGNFTDAELLELAAFARTIDSTRPLWSIRRPRKEDNDPQIVQAAANGNLFLKSLIDETMVTITIRKGPFSGNFVVIQKIGEKWTIISEGVIAA